MFLVLLRCLDVVGFWMFLNLGFVFDCCWLELVLLLILVLGFVWGLLLWFGLFCLFNSLAVCWWGSVV